jgi:hypothetical protein
MILQQLLAELIIEVLEDVFGTISDYRITIVMLIKYPLSIFRLFLGIVLWETLKEFNHKTVIP